MKTREGNKSGSVWSEECSIEGGTRKEQSTTLCRIRRRGTFIGRDVELGEAIKEVVILIEGGGRSERICGEGELNEFIVVD